MERGILDPLEMDSWHRERLLEALEAFREGVGDAPLLRKWIESSNSTATSSSARTKQDDSSPALKGNPPASMDFVLSTDEVDRHGDVIATSGWNLESYRKNPVFLWAHDYARPVIGRAVDAWLEPHRLLARVDFAPTAFAQEMAGLYQAGYQRGVSVGFKPLRFEERRNDKTGALLGIRFLEQELLELSAVPVPANRSALRRALNEAPLAAEYLRRSGNETEHSTSNPSVYSLPTTSLSSPSGRQAFEAMWSVLSARIDDMSKLTEELAREVAEVEKAAFSGETYSFAENEVLEILAALREFQN